MMEIDTQVSDLQDVVSRDYGEPSSLIGTGFLPENFIPPPSIDPPSYAAAAQPLLNDNQNFVPAHDKENDLPDRPCSAFLNPHVCFTPDEFFASLQLAQVDPQMISCVQCQYNGEVVVTFRGVSQRDAFLAKSVLQINGQPFALQDIDRPPTYLQIFDCQYEMPDSTIINCLCSHKSTHPKFHAFWQNCNKSTLSWSTAHVSPLQPVWSSGKFMQRTGLFQLRRHRPSSRHVSSPGEM